MNRSCTDVIICLIFTLFFAGMFAVAAYGYALGDPYKLITVYDQDGKHAPANHTLIRPISLEEEMKRG